MMFIMPFELHKFDTYKHSRIIVIQISPQTIPDFDKILKNKTPKNPVCKITDNAQQSGGMGEYWCSINVFRSKGVQSTGSVGNPQPLARRNRSETMPGKEELFLAYSSLFVIDFYPYCCYLYHSIKIGSYFYPQNYLHTKR